MKHGKRGVMSSEYQLADSAFSQLRMLWFCCGPLLVHAVYSVFCACIPLQIVNSMLRHAPSAIMNSDLTD